MDSEINVDAVVSIIQRKISEQGGRVIIPNQRGGNFAVKLVKGGIEVDNLGNQPFLPWQVFTEAKNILIRKDGVAQRGDAMNSRLGSESLPFDSIEGYIASVVYKRKAGDSVFRRITPVACILKWAGICRLVSGKVILL